MFYDFHIVYGREKLFKKLLIIGALLSVFFCCNAFADNVTCESDETLINGVCEPVCNGTTTNFEYNGTCIKNKFQVTTVSMAAGETFKFQINASGQFYIDWDDPNSAQPVTYQSTSSYGTTFSHTFTDAGVHVIKFGGPGATGYHNSSASYSAIRFGTTVGNSGFTPQKIASVSGSLGSLFPTLNDGSNDLSKQPRFYETFYGASNLTSIGPGLFDGVSGATDYMFYSTFLGCSSLTSLPDGLFDGVSGATNYMFYSTFSSCSSLTSLPDGLFDGVSGAASSMFNSTFYNCSGLTSLPDGLFDGVSGAASSMFNSTFSNCGGLTSLPDGLFDGVSGAASSMFSHTFYNCSGLTSLPDGLFDGVSGIASSMFSYTFYNCGNLQTIPADLFSHISGTPASGMFSSTFSSCAKLKYFDYGNGTIVNYIPPTFFEHLDSTNYSSGPLSYMFYNTGIATQCPGGTYQYLTGFEADFSSKVSCTPCPNNLSSYPGSTSADQCYTCEQDHFEYNGACINTKFKVTTVSMAAGETFKFQINAYGQFYIDWDDPNSAQPVTYQSTSYGTTFSHTFTDAGVHVIKFGGPGATGYYNSSTSYPAILFGSSSNMSFSTAYSSKIASVSGSLGSLFSTLNDGSNDLSKQPRFYETFYGATNLTSIGPGLFDGVFGAADYMFAGTFSGCSSLTSLPDGLFDGVSGAASSMFSSTFYSCSGLTSLPDGLFDGVSGAASSMFNSTFSRCSSLTSLPDGLFDGVSGVASSMFSYTFLSCSNLQTIPADLFSHISGTPASGMFSSTFSSCSKLKYFDYGNGTTVNYIPPTFFEHLDSTNYSSGPLRYMFDYTGIATQCPANTYQYLTGFEADFSSRVSCMTCPNGTISPAGSTNVSQCVLPSIDLHWDTTIDNNVIDTTCNIGENIVLPAQPTKPGYTFTGWLLQSNP